ncbi:MAG: hypothetical protein JJE03_04080 [Peptostreptococcaceae bacterium]|nr:hypothetical protein [Peptostreptococcaceae bacterium]
MKVLEPLNIEGCEPMKEKVKIMKFILIGLLIVFIILMFIKNSVTPSNLGVINGELSPLPKSPNCVSSYTLDKERYVEPIPFIGT